MFCLARTRFLLFCLLCVTITIISQQISVRRCGLRGSIPSTPPCHLRRRLYQHLRMHNCFRNRLYPQGFKYVATHFFFFLFPLLSLEWWKLWILGGEQLLNLPAVLKFPFYDEETLEQRFPFRTFLMLASIVLQLIVSAVAKNVFVQGYLSSKYDVFKCFDSNSSIIVAIDSKLNSGDAKDIDEETFFLNDSQPIPLRQSSKWSCDGICNYTSNF